jgi:SAM-dependent methyltransferase
MAELRRACATCGGGEGVRLFEQRFAMIDGGSVLDGYDVVACGSCGAVFGDGVPDQSALDAYYRDLSKYENAALAGHESDTDRLRFGVTADLLARQVPSPGARVLEIGCASGGLLAQLAQRGVRDVQGLDPSPACGAAARRLHDVEVRTGSIFDDAWRGETFDLVVLIAVLEHLRDLPRTFGVLRGLLRPGGLLHLEVPDAQAFSEHVEVPFQQFSVEHINFFTDASLANLAGRFGFETVSLGREVRDTGRRGQEPVTHGTFLFDGVPRPAKQDEKGPASIRAYVARSRALEARSIAEAARIAQEGRPVLVWSVGTQALRLLATTPLGTADIRAFIDSNPRYAGKTLNGRPIVPPLQIRAFSEPIVIASTGFQDAIVRQIRSLGLPNEIILLEPERR